jgi:hypothetical protein
VASSVDFVLDSGDDAQMVARDREMEKARQLAVKH